MSLTSLTSINFHFVAKKFGELYNSPENSYALEELDAIFRSSAAPPASPEPALQSWSDYFAWRGLNLDSPAAILMQWPLTLYHIMTNLYPKHCKMTHATISFLACCVINIVNVSLPEANVVGFKA